MVDVITAEDIPGANGADDDKLLAVEEVGMGHVSPDACANRHPRTPWRSTALVSWLFLLLRCRSTRALAPLYPDAFINLAFLKLGNNTLNKNES